MKYVFVVLSVMFSTSMFGQFIGRVYEHPNMERMVAQHKKVAILPFNYELSVRNMRRVTEEEIAQEEHQNRLEAQSQFYIYALRKLAKSESNVTFQSPTETIVLLERAGVDVDNIDGYLVGELCDILGVDAVVKGDIFSTRMMNQNLAMVVDIFTDINLRTGNSKARIEVIDKNEEIVWAYGKEINSGAYTNMSDLIRILMRKSARRFPYFKKKGLFS